MNKLAAIAIIVTGMLGLHFDIEYSGWVLFIGCVVALS